MRRSPAWITCYLLLPLSLGLYLFSLTLEVAAVVRKISIFGNVQVQEDPMKLLDTIERLFQDGDMFLGIMLTLFTLVFPIGKYIALAYVLFAKCWDRRLNVLRYIKNLGQWSMGDVFVVAFFVVFLKINDLPGDVVTVNVEVRNGLYVFAASVLTSIVISALLGLDIDKRLASGKIQKGTCES